jgi:hypothetical protein
MGEASGLAADDEVPPALRDTATGERTRGPPIAGDPGEQRLDGEKSRRGHAAAKTRQEARQDAQRNLFRQPH